MADDAANWELRELKNLLERNHADNREDILDLKAQLARDVAHIIGQLDRYVLREVYAADKAALEARLARMEREQEASRNAARAAVYAAAGSIVATVLAAIILSQVLRGR